MHALHWLYAYALLLTVISHYNRCQHGFDFAGNPMRHAVMLCSITIACD